VREVGRGRRPAATARFLATLSAAALAAGCEIGQGGGLPAQVQGETYPGVRVEIRGALATTPYGCRQLEIDGETWFVIWPAGSGLADGVRLPGGQVVAEGDAVVGIGAFTPTAPLAATNEYWRRTFISCAPGAEEVLVLDVATVDPAG
jgi:hypothetical protein